MSQDEVESQLSAMFDGELPAAECELLSRRIDRDENLRTRWSRYALVGAAMRFEPVATARSNFAARVSSALQQAEGAAATAGLAAGAAARASRSRHLWWQAALAATLVGAVAGLSITMLRNVTLEGSVDGLRSARNGVDVPLGQVAGTALLPAAADLQRQAAVLAGRTLPASTVSTDSTAAGTAAAGTSVAGTLAAGAPAAGAAREPWSYVTPPNDSGVNTPLRTELVGYIVAHSEYSTPLMRPDLLSELISGEAGLDSPPSAAGADSAPGGASSPVDAEVGQIDATATSVSASGR